jgi:hypothetical protein
VALSLFAIVHLLAGAANVSKDTGPGKALRAVTMPWEKVLAVHQTWPMFAVPPTATGVLQVRGVPMGGGPMVELQPLPGEPPFDGVVWVYARAGKLERNATSKKRDYLRASLTRSLCRRHPELAAIRFDRVSRRTPPPRFGAPFLPRRAWGVTSTHLEQWNCKR